MPVVIQRNPQRLQEWLCRSLCRKGLNTHTFISFISPSYEYLWYILDGSLLFKLHTQRLVKEPEVEMGFHFGDKACIFWYLDKKKCRSFLKQIVLQLIADDWPDKLLGPPHGLSLLQGSTCGRFLDVIFVISSNTAETVSPLAAASLSLTYRFSLVPPLWSRLKYHSNYELDLWVQL